MVRSAGRRAAIVQFGILGPLEAWAGERRLRLGGAKQRALLAYLLLHRGELVPSERLIDELWNGAPPATAAKIVHVYVSRLRRALGNGVLATKNRAYVLELAPGQVDIDRFEELVAEGRRLFEAGDPRAAARTLGEALNLWRGPPLSDLAYESFAQGEIARLEELRLGTLESRIEAELAAGAGPELIPELEALVRKHPLRERLHGQLMLALYRAGRQADALEAYRQVRHVLDEQLGLDPGPELRELERAILTHEPALSSPRRPALAQARRHAPLLLGIGAALLAAAVAGAVYGLSRDSRTAGLASLAPNTVGEIDAATGRIVAQVPAGARPDAVVAGDGALWVANLADHSVARIDPARHELVRSIAASDEPTALAGGGHVWLVASGGEVSRVDAQFDTLRPVARVNTGPVLSGHAASGVTVGFGSVWASSEVGLVYRVDPRSGRLLALIEVGNGAAGVAAGADSVWVANSIDGTVSRIDPTNAVTATIPVGHGPRGIAVGAGAVWVSNFFDDAMVRIDPTTNAVVATIPVGDGPLGIAATTDAIWVANSGSGTVSEVDPARDAVVRTIPIGNRPEQLVAYGDSVWVTVQKAAPPIAAGGTARFALQEEPVLDPAKAADSASFQLLYATCAKLLNYPDEPAPRGSRLVPEVAAAMPAISAGGRTYTFTVRPGFRFSPPSNEQVTAATFKHAIERALNPRMQAPYARLLGDVVGAQAYVAGKARHISGIVARGRSLTIRLVHAVGDLPARLSMPTFCAVPLDAPADPKGVSNLPAAGPYYVASHTPGAQIVLKRNPNYRGERPHRLAELDYMIGVGQQQAFREVLSGKADYAADGIPPEETAHARARYGPGSPPARAGRQQYFTNPLLTVRYLLLNPDRPLFADARLRRAVNYAIDRRALVAELRRLFGSGLSGGGRSTDQYLPPGMAGYSATPLYPLAGPDLSRARGLAGGHRRTAVLFACNTPPCPQIAQIVRKNLARIGIDVQIRAMPKAVMFARAAAPHPGYDLLLFGWAADYPDPANFLVPLFSRTLATAAGVGQFTRFDDPAYNRALARASGLTGAKRARVYAQLARSLARDAAPAVAYENDESRDFFSARIGCQIFQPIYGMDIGALCLRRPSPRAAPAAAP